MGGHDRPAGNGLLNSASLKARGAPAAADPVRCG